MKHFLSSFPDRISLISRYPKVEVLPVNAHVHTPFSFSAFTGINQIFELAVKERISVIGINDFFVTDGYESFHNEALKTGVLPLFNIEFISLLKKEQEAGIRVNDPNNPGRCYFCGKGLNYPFTLDDKRRKKLMVVIAESQDQVKAMITKANTWFDSINAGIVLDYEQIRKSYAKELVRERHIAKAIRVETFKKCDTDTARNTFLSLIFNGKAPKSALSDVPGLENEIRTNLLKAGGLAFVEERDAAFMSLDEVIDFVVNAGGIPCYPVLLDDKNGNYTEYEKDPEKLWHELTAKKIGCIELIPGRNDALHLERFVDFFNNKGFVILFGTEHNTPDMIPLTCDTRGNKPLSGKMEQVAYEGACVVAAHQYLNANGYSGFIDGMGAAKTDDRNSFIILGNAVIHFFKDQFKKTK